MTEQSKEQVVQNSLQESTKPADGIDQQVEQLSVGEHQNYDQGYEVAIDQKTKRLIYNLINPGHQEKLQEISTIGGCIRIIKEELTNLRSAQRINVQIINRLKNMPPEKQGKIPKLLTTIEGLRAHRKSLILIKAELSAKLKQTETASAA